MPEHLVDILNDKNTVLHVLPVYIDADGAPPAVVEHKALEIADHEAIVPGGQKLKARLHVTRGGPLMPYGDNAKIKHEQRMRHEQRIRECAYFLWQEAGCPHNQSDAFWLKAAALQAEFKI